MSSFLNRYFPVALLYILISIVLPLNHLYAQCNLTTIQKDAITIIGTTDDYLYFKTKAQYYGLSIKTNMVKKSTGNRFFLTIKYTSATVTGNPSKLIFDFVDVASIACKLKFLKTLNTDDFMLKTKVCEAELNNTTINALKLHPLKVIKFIFNNNKKTVGIPVSTPQLMQLQLACLQTMQQS